MEQYRAGTLDPYVEQRLKQIGYERILNPGNYYRQNENRYEPKFLNALQSLGHGPMSRDELVTSGELFNFKPDAFIISHQNNGRRFGYQLEIEEKNHTDRTVRYQQLRAFMLRNMMDYLELDGLHVMLISSGVEIDIMQPQLEAVDEALWEEYENPVEGFRATYIDFPENHFHVAASQKRVIQDGDAGVNFATEVDHSEDERYSFYDEVNVKNTEGVVPLR